MTLVRCMASQTSGLVKRPPVVTIMGHVDHGKTTLLDHLRNSKIVEQEFGGITQHIGAFKVPFKQSDKTEFVTFIDTPGHAAFAAMRQRGANVTDIVVLVIACEDGVSEQTIESINFAKNSQVPIIVAVNKIDKYQDKQEFDKRIQYIRRQLVVQDVVPEADGGEVQLVGISALNGTGVETLKESILALSETLDLKAEIDCPVSGNIIESQLDPHRGKLCTVLVSKGVLKKGDVIIAGTNNWAKVRALFDERGRMSQSCGPGEPIQVTGWREDQLPAAGDPIQQVNDQTEAKSIIAKFRLEVSQQRAMEDAKAAAARYETYRALYKEKLNEKREGNSRYRRIFFNPRGQRPKESEDKQDDLKINLLLKCDVDGSLDALLDVLDTYDKDNRQPVKLDLMHYGVGPITENDYRLASSFSNSVIYGFNVKLANQSLFTQARKEGLEIKMFNVIYNLFDDLKRRLSEKIPEIEKEEEIGQANVLQEFVITELNKKKVHVAGCRCSRGVLKRNEGIFYKLIRLKETIESDMEIRSMKHLKEEAKEIEKERECGISFKGREDLEFKPGDLLVCYEKKKFRPKLKWDLKGFA